MLHRHIVVISAFILSVCGKNEEYMGHKVYNVKFNTQEQQDSFHELQSDSIDFWRKPSVKHGVTGRAMVPPSHFQWFEEKLEKLGVDKDIVVDDVYEYLAGVQKTLVRTTRNEDERAFDFDGYYRYDEILTHLETLQEIYANSSISVTLEEFGRTEENRPIVYLKVTDNTNAEDDKPVVIVEAAINPREWITVPAALNIVNRLLEDETQFLGKSEWIIIPVLNPDGYEYTHTNLRLWTKSRSTRSNLGFICPGVNINRNFDVAWLISDSSSSPCSHLYAGVEPFSEIESQLTKYLVEEYENRIRLYISLQNTGGFVSYPWQFERAATGMFIQHHRLGLQMVEAMNDEYIVDIGWQALGDRASGTSTDFVQGSGVLYSFTVDAVQRGLDGVNIPEGEIRNVIEDIWKAVAVAAERLL